MSSVVICEPVRTPIGRYGGIYKSRSAVELAVAALTGLLERGGRLPATLGRGDGQGLAVIFERVDD